MITNDEESYVETSSEFTTGNEDQNLLINLNDNINNQSENNSNNSQLDNSIGSNVSPDEIGINELHNDSKSCNNTYDENKINEQLTAIRQIQHDDYIRMKT